MIKVVIHFVPNFSSMRLVQDIDKLNVSYSAFMKKKELG